MSGKFHQQEFQGRSEGSECKPCPTSTVWFQLFHQQQCIRLTRIYSCSTMLSQHCLCASSPDVGSHPELDKGVCTQHDIAWNSTRQNHMVVWRATQVNICRCNLYLMPGSTGWELSVDGFYDNDDWALTGSSRENRSGTSSRICVWNLTLFEAAVPIMWAAVALRELKDALLPGSVRWSITGLNPPRIRRSAVHMQAHQQDVDGLCRNRLTI